MMELACVTLEACSPMTAICNSAPALSHFAIPRCYCLCLNVPPKPLAVMGGRLFRGADSSLWLVHGSMLIQLGKFQADSRPVQ